MKCSFNPTTQQKRETHSLNEKKFRNIWGLFPDFTKYVLNSIVCFIILLTRIIIVIVFNSDLSLFKATEVMIGKFGEGKPFALALFIGHKID